MCLTSRVTLGAEGPTLKVPCYCGEKPGLPRLVHGFLRDKIASHQLSLRKQEVRPFRSSRWPFSFCTKIRSGLQLCSVLHLALPMSRLPALDPSLLLCSRSSCIFRTHYRKAWRLSGTVRTVLLILMTVFRIAGYWSVALLFLSEAFFSTKVRAFSQG